MLNRRIFAQLEQWLKSGIRKAAFLDGARQVCPKATTTARIWSHQRFWTDGSSEYFMHRTGAALVRFA